MLERIVPLSVVVTSVSTFLTEGKKDVRGHRKEEIEAGGQEAGERGSMGTCSSCRVIEFSALVRQQIMMAAVETEKDKSVAIIIPKKRVKLTIIIKSSGEEMGQSGLKQPTKRIKLVPEIRERDWSGLQIHWLYL
ncbi:uncharacterized protein BT62DRAFT_921495 [Guyanagaster necrorhizus]|uniref:Uncharacterized protein n=1 Tax=Guyanagaster necrorhizus TaxID=856835 RepID=A0A9P8AQQ8_9AGAR|nr:uncharacterized protein BT62DRAFT_921495 [Guyanagaster necrorhizus MCA 3950]KAG7444260.1 hypothetical protein BT62DRAFT_921495 [Guyanagaster necrorhizus MCA 3950]